MRRSNENYWSGRPRDLSLRARNRDVHIIGQLVHADADLHHTLGLFGGIGRILISHNQKTQARSQISV